MATAFEARAISAHLPNRTITFIYKDGYPSLAGGIFRIERVRTATKQDEATFPGPPDHVCPMCGQEEVG